MERRASDIKIAKIEKDIDFFRNEQRELVIEIKETNKKLDDRFDKIVDDFRHVIHNHEQVERSNLNELRNIYALKWVEKLMWVVLTAIVGILVSLVFGTNLF